MAVEFVVLTPVLVAIMMLVVAFGRYVDIEGEVESAARDAVRAASLERDLATAQAVAQGVANDSVPGNVNCSAVTIGGSFSSGGTITAQLSCDVSYDGLGLIGLPGSVTIDGQSSAPIDTLRRTE